MIEHNSPVSYAKYLAGYMSDPSTIRARVKDEFGRAPSIDIIKKIRAEKLKKNRVEGYALCDSRYTPLFKCGHEETADNIVLAFNGIDKCRTCEEAKAKAAAEREEKRRAQLERKMEAERKMREARKSVNIAQTLHTILEMPPSERPRLATEVIRRVAQIFQITPEDITGPDRHMMFTDARSAVTLILRERGMSYPKIARFLNRDHSSVIYFANRVPKHAVRNPLILKAHEVLR